MAKMRIVLEEGTFDYHIQELSRDRDLSEVRCGKCAGKLRLHGEILQWGFWEDKHTYLTECQKCQRRIAVEQVLVFDSEVNNEE